MALAVLLGQLSIGWGNDALDAARDTTAGRRDKPVAAGRVEVRTVAAAAGLSLTACVPASLALGWWPGLLHLIAVASGWSYNLALKRGPLSPMPYALSFGLLPSVVAPPPVAVALAAALLGVAAHFANTVADVEADALTGVRGLPQRLGPQRSLHVAAGCLAAAALCLLATPGAPGWAAVRVVVLGVGAAVGLGVAVVGPRLGRQAFVGVLVAVALVIAGYLASEPA